MSEKIKQALEIIVNSVQSKREDDTELKGTLGLPGNVADPFTVNGRPGRTYVVVATTSGQSIYTPLNLGVALIKNTPVVLRKTKQGDWYIQGVNPDKSEEFFGKLAKLASDVGPHSHRPGLGLEDMVEGIQFLPGLVTVVSGLTVQINPFYYRWNGTDGYFAGTTVDLTINVPSTSGVQHWVKITFNMTSAALTVTIGADVSVLIPLTPADLAAIAVAGDSVLPLMGVRLRYAQASLKRQDFEDARPHLSGVNAATTTTLLSGAVILAPDSATRNMIIPTAVTYPNLILKAFASQTADFLQFLSSAGATLAKVTVAGVAQFAKLIIGGASLDASAVAQIDSTTQGFAAPRMTTTQRDAISLPMEGLMIYNTTTHQYEQRTNSAWIAMGGTDRSIIAQQWAYFLS